MQFVGCLSVDDVLWQWLWWLRTAPGLLFCLTNDGQMNCTHEKLNGVLEKQNAFLSSCKIIKHFVCGPEQNLLVENGKGTCET